MENSFNQIKKTIHHVPAYFEQHLLFTIHEEKLNERGKKISKEITREVLIDYIGFIDGLHKYQICCSDCSIKSVRWPTITDDLYIELDIIFSLLVVSADVQGNLVQLHNFPYLQEEWAEMKEQLLIEYDERGEERWALIQDMDALMQDYNKVLSYLKSPSMYGLFFNGYWQEKDVQTVQYGNELNNTIFEEEIEGFIKETETQQLVTIQVTGKPVEMNENTVQYTGFCAFINGALNECYKQILLDKSQFNFSARWIGLKQRFQQ